VGDDDASWVEPAYRELHRVLKDDGFVVTFYGLLHSDIFAGTFKALGFRIVSHLAFAKNDWGLGRFTRGQHETAFLLAKGRPKIFDYAFSDVIVWTREQVAAHPNQRPVQALYPLIESSSPNGGSVPGPFLGSGSTLREAKDFGRKGIGIEIEERWCRYAAERLREEVLFAK
jgi:site-specific DNA-methyltransferase (adenine-specific)